MNGQLISFRTTKRRRNFWENIIPRWIKAMRKFNCFCCGDNINLRNWKHFNKLKKLRNKQINRFSTIALGASLNCFKALVAISLNCDLLHFSHEQNFFFKNCKSFLTSSKSHSTPGTSLLEKNLCSSHDWKSSWEVDVNVGGGINRERRKVSFT